MAVRSAVLLIGLVAFVAGIGRMEVCAQGTEAPRPEAASRHRSLIWDDLRLGSAFFPISALARVRHDSRLETTVSAAVAAPCGLGIGPDQSMRRSLTLLAAFALAATLAVVLVLP